MIPDSLHALAEQAQQIAFLRAKTNQQSQAVADLLTPRANKWNQLHKQAAKAIEAAKQYIPPHTNTLYSPINRDNNTLLDKQDSIKRVLEIPNVIASCVRNGQQSYDDAIDLYIHAKNVLEPHKNNKLVLKIVRYTIIKS